LKGIYRTNEQAAFSTQGIREAAHLKQSRQKPVKDDLMAQPLQINPLFRTCKTELETHLTLQGVPQFS
jgi:hypothetical protein